MSIASVAVSAALLSAADSGSRKRFAAFDGLQEGGVAGSTVLAATTSAAALHTGAAAAAPIPTAAVAELYLPSDPCTERGIDAERPQCTL